MKFPLKTLLAATALGLANIATPAFADIIAQPSSFSQGTLVHTDGEESGSDVTGTLGGGPSAPLIVHFQGQTDADAPDDNIVHLQQGNGQAELTGIELGGNDSANLISGDIFLSTDPSGSGSPTDADNLGMEWIELAFTGVTADWVTFTLTLDGEPDYVSDPFAIDHNPNGENKFAFQAINGESILNLHYVFTGGTADALRQVRIASTEGGVPPVPEASTWAMMLVGFGAIGYSMRRRRKTVLAQVA